MRAAALLLLLSSAAVADEDPGAALEAERDRMLDQIVRGVDVASSVRRFSELAQRRKDLIAAREKAISDARAVEEKSRADRAAADRWRTDYARTVDYSATIACRFAVDATHPPAVPYSDRGLADWGPVVRKETLDLPKDGPLNGERATLYEIAGKVRRYHVEIGRAERWHGFVAERGDLVLVCDHDVVHDGRAPREWNPFQYHGEVARIAHPPKIAEKRRWNPAHLSHEDLRRAIYSKKWPLPPGQKALFACYVDEDLGSGRYRVKQMSGGEWIVVVPPALPRRDRIVVGHAIWAIAGDPAWEGKELVLTVEDVEERYVD